MLADLRSFILDDPSISAIVGQRVYLRRLPQSPTIPSIVYARVTTRRSHDLDGPDHLPRALVQITSWTSSMADSSSLSSLLRSRLDGFRGTMGSIEVGSILCSGERDTEEPETGRTGVILEFQVQFEE